MNIAELGGQKCRSGQIHPSIVSVTDPRNIQRQIRGDELWCESRGMRGPAS